MEKTGPELSSIPGTFPISRRGSSMRADFDRRKRIPPEARVAFLQKSESTPTMIHETHSHARAHERDMHTYTRTRNYIIRKEGGTGVESVSESFEKGCEKETGKTRRTLLVK